MSVLKNKFWRTIIFFMLILVLSLIIGFSIKEGLEYTPDAIVQYHDTIKDIEAQNEEDAGYFENSPDKFSDDSLFQGENINNRHKMSSNFVPTYEDSVFLSKTSSISHSFPVTPSSSIAAGFCHYQQANPMGTEQKCLETKHDTCASTDCCVLLGGVKCVSGNQHGPTLTSNYNNPDTQHADHYYYKGKCYGNCPSIRM